MSTLSRYPFSIVSFFNVIALNVPSNADSPISFTLPGITSSSMWCKWKAFLPIFVTDAGIVRLVSLAPANAISPISVTVSGMST